MNCALAETHTLAEKYAAGQLSEAEKEAFEVHFFECPHCLEEVRVLQLARDVLEQDGELRDALTDRKETSTRWLWWAGLAAAAALAIVTVRLRIDRAPEPSVEPVASAESVSPEAAVQPDFESESAIPAAEQTAEVHPVEPAQQVERANNRALLLAALAVIEPAPYERVVLRGVADEASRQFDEGMKQYLAGDFASAAGHLQKAGTLDPERTDIAFYHGVSLLLTGADEVAASELTRAVALNDPVFRDEARFYLAKAHLRTGRLDAAEVELQQVAGSDGPLAPAAATLLEQLGSLP